MPPLPSSGGSHMRSTLPQRVVKQLANATAADAARGWPRGREQGTEGQRLWEPRADSMRWPHDLADSQSCAL